ncbi:MAG TPA: septum formation initiator family protein [Gemmatimonadaceae bacterium]|nr:septum formation initiator family protein [Gemmatimonadaceae bacterium]
MSPAKKPKDPPPPRDARKKRGVGRRLLLLAGIIGVAWYAVQGGEYSTFALLSQRSKRDQLREDVAAMQREVDSLAKWKRAVLNDPVVQEKIAREEFGMVRGNKELLYRFYDSVRKN